MTKNDSIDIYNIICSQLSSSLLFLDEGGYITTHAKEGNKPIAHVTMCSIDKRMDNIYIEDMAGNKKEIPGKITTTFSVEIMAIEGGAVIPKKELSLDDPEWIDENDDPQPVKEPVKIKSAYSDFAFIDLEGI